MFLCMYDSLVSDYDPEQFADDSVPILVVGTKEDLMGSVREGRQTSSLDASGADAINVVQLAIPLLSN